MNSILTLLAVSAFLGLALGLYFSSIAILVSGPILAIFSATVSQNEGFDALTGIAIIVVCLTVNQGAYLIGVTWLLGVCEPMKRPYLKTTQTMNQARSDRPLIPEQ